MLIANLKIAPTITSFIPRVTILPEVDSENKRDLAPNQLKVNVQIQLNKLSRTLRTVSLLYWHESTVSKCAHFK